MSLKNLGMPLTKPSNTNTILTNSTLGNTRSGINTTSNGKVHKKKVKTTTGSGSKIKNQKMISVKDRPVLLNHLKRQSIDHDSMQTGTVNNSLLKRESS